MKMNLQTEFIELAKENCTRLWNRLYDMVEIKTLQKLTSNKLEQIKKSEKYAASVLSDILFYRKGSNIVQEIKVS